MHRGYIKLWRKIRDNPRMHDSDYMAAWAWCLIEATYCQKKSIFGGKEIELQPGQFTTGRRQFSELSGIQESKLERIFICFVNNGQIEQQTSNTNRLISICNWKEYQDIEQQMNNNRTTDEQQVNTLKELKKEKKEKNKDKTSMEFIIPDHLKEIWPFYLEMRKLIKKPATINAQESIIQKLEKLAPGRPEDQVKIVQQSIDNSWQGVFELKQNVFNKPNNATIRPRESILSGVHRE